MALEIFKLVGSVFIDTDEANKSLQKTDDKASSFATNLGSMAKTAVGVGAAVGTAIAGAGAAMIGIANDAADTADEIDKMSQKIGISAQSYQEWSYVMSQNGMDINQLETGMKTLVTQMDKVKEGNEDATTMFQELGVEVLNADGSLRSQEEVLEDTIKALAEMGDTAERARLQSELFGRAGTDMAPMLNQGADAIDDLQNRAHELGLVMSDEAISAGVEFGDLSADLEASFGMLKTNLGTALFPVLNEVIKKIIDFMPTLQSIAGELGPIAASFVEGLLPPLADLAADLLPSLFEVVQGIMPLISTMVADLVPVLVDVLNILIPVLVEILSQVLPVIADLLSLILPLISTLLEGLTPILSAVLQLLQPLLQLVTAILEPVIGLLTAILEPLLTILNTILVPLINMSGEMVALLASFISMILEPILALLGMIIAPLLEILNACLAPLFQLLQTIYSWGVGVSQGIADWLKGFFNFVIENVGTKITGVFTKLQDVITNVWEGIKNVFKSGVNFCIGVINNLMSGLNSIQPPQWLADKVGITGFNFSPIPMLAKGGTLASSGSVMVGEKGPEVLDLPKGARVSPLDKVGAEIDYDKLAAAIVGAMSSMQVVAPVYIGQSLIDTVVTDAITRQAYISGGR